MKNVAEAENAAQTGSQLPTVYGSYNLESEGLTPPAGATSELRTSRLMCKKSCDGSLKAEEGHFFGHFLQPKQPALARGAQMGVSKNQHPTGCRAPST